MNAVSLAPIYLGTMGWAYEDWRGPFYSTGLAQAKMLEELGRTLPTVELDTTFYGTPRPTTLDGWAKQTPPGFRFSAKVPKAISHERRLHAASEAALDFANLLQDRLGDKLAALLLQLPPDFSASEYDTLKTFLDGVSGGRQKRTFPWVVEVRHASWSEIPLAADLASRGIACAATERIDVGGIDPALHPPLRYVRLLGAQGSVARFDERQFDRTTEMQTWANNIDTVRRADTAPIYLYVRNFWEGHAPGSLQVLGKMLGLAPFSPPGQQQMNLF